MRIQQLKTLISSGISRISKFSFIRDLLSIKVCRINLRAPYYFFTTPITVFSNDIHTQTEIVESFVKVYSNLETLCLINEDRRDDISMVQDCLSSIKFPNLTSLSLRRFKFHDGAFLLQVIVLFSKISFSKKANSYLYKKKIIGY